MATLKMLATALAFVGSTSLALAQGPGIGPEGNVLPPQTNANGTAASPASPTQSTQSNHLYKSHRLYNMAPMSKKKHHTTSTR